MKSWFAFPLLVFALNLEAKPIKTCGVYYAEGFYTEIESPLHKGAKKRVILLDRNSASEIRFFITNKNITKLLSDDLLGTNFKLELKFNSSCFYDCEGEIAKVIGPLDLPQEPKPLRLVGI